MKNKGGKNNGHCARFWNDTWGFIALYIGNFVLLTALFIFLDGFKTTGGLLYYFLLSLVFFLSFLLYYWLKKKKEYRLTDDKDATAAHEREKAIIYEKHYKEHLLFINRWIHYIKTPLSVIRSITQEADSTTEMEQIQVESDRILDGVNSALNFARATDFVTDFKIEPFDLYEMFVELINDLKMNFIRNHVYPDLQLSPETLICSDRKWLKFIFFQLMTNAIKYSFPEGKISIYIQKTKNLNNTFSICVKDTGIGITKEDLPRIFDIFYTGTTGRSRGESTGIGLYLVKTICERLNYTVTAASTVSSGTIIEIGNLTTL